MNVHDTSVAFDMNKYGVGQPVRRTEDPILVQGQGHYTDDLSLPGQAYAVFVRSRNGHGMIKSIDTSAAKAMPGVLAVYTGDDLAGYGTMKCAVPFKNRDGSRDEEAAAPLDAHRQGALRRRSDRRRGRRDADAGEGCRRSGRGRHRGAARGHQGERSRANPARRNSTTTCPATSRSTITTARPRRSRTPSPRPRM